MLTTIKDEVAKVNIKTDVAKVNIKTDVAKVNIKTDDTLGPLRGLIRVAN